MGRLQQPARFVAGLHGQRAVTAYHGLVGGDAMAQLQLPRGRRDPYAIYERLRGVGPMAPTRLGNWATVSHAVCEEVLRDRRFGARPADWQPGPADVDVSFLDMNPPDHTRLRRLVAPAFTARRVVDYRPLVERTAHGLLDRAGARFDLVRAFAAPLPIAVISELLGVPAEERSAFARYGAVIGSSLDGVRGLAHARALLAANTELEALFGRLFALRRHRPGPDLISAVVAGEGESRLRPAEMVPLCVLLLVAGFETTVNLVGNAVLALTRHPEQWALLRAEPDRAAAAVEETLRWDPPVQRTARFALTDLELAGVSVRAGQVVVTLLGGANRDPDVYPHADRFDLTRPRGAEHLAFSAGIHYCLGAPLARLEAAVALRALAERLPGLHRTGPALRRRSITIRGPRRLPVAA